MSAPPTVPGMPSAFSHRGSNDLRHRTGRARLDPNRFAFFPPIDFAEIANQMNHRAAYTAIADQDVAAIAQKKNRSAVAIEQRQRARQRLARLDLNEVVRRAADLHRRIAR